MLYPLNLAQILCAMIQILELRHIEPMKHEHGHVLGQGYIPYKVAFWYDMLEHGHPCHHACTY